MKYLMIIIVFFIIFSFQTIPLNKFKKIKKQKISIEVKGNLQNPGDFTLINGSTVADLLNKLELKDSSDVDHLNKNKRLYDMDVIVVGKKKKTEKISINSASKESLMSLSGIGPSKADAIIAYRNNKTFQSLEDLMKVKGIGEKIFQKLKDSIKL